MIGSSAYIGVTDDFVVFGATAVSGDSFNSKVKENE